jgi:RNA polymerase sigma factor (sigma-70 family)
MSATSKGTNGGGSPTPAQWNALRILLGKGLSRFFNVDTEDFVQEELANHLRRHRKIASAIVVDGKGSVDDRASEWLQEELQLSTNRIRYRIRGLIRRVTRQRRLLSENAEHVHREPQPSPSEIIAAKDLVALLRRFISELPPRQKTVMEMAYTYELENSQIAERLNISEKTVERDQQRAIEKIRRKFQKESGNDQ